MTQLSIFGITPDQNSYQSEKWGTLTFYPTKSDKWNVTCRHCLLWESVPGHFPECLDAPCQSTERTDGKNGYFSIHDYPINKTIKNSN